MSWREQLKALFGDWNGRYVVTSPDVDGILSALIVLRHYPEAKLFGLYDTERLVRIDGDATWQDAKEALWVDLDVLGNVRCIGQHLLQMYENDCFPTRHPLSFNPNIALDQPWIHSFLGGKDKERNGKKTKRDKYPFGTVQLLMEHFDEPLPDIDQNPIGRALIAHADSSWASAVKYRDNCLLWQRDMFETNIEQDSTTAAVSPQTENKDVANSDNNNISGKNHSLDYLFGYTRSESALKTHQAMVQQLEEKAGKAMFKKGSRKNCDNGEDTLSSGWLNVMGKQSLEYRAICAQLKECITEEKQLAAWLVAFARVWCWMEEKTGWRSPGSSLVAAEEIAAHGLKKGNVFVKGTHRFGSTKLKSLQHFVDFGNVFSFAIIAHKTLRYTKDFELISQTDEEDDENKNDETNVNGGESSKKRTFADVSESANKKIKLE